MTPDHPSSFRARRGTSSGEHAHRGRGEEPCESCRTAKATYDKRRYDDPRVAQRLRLAAKAQGIAKTKLVAQHRDEYQTLYRAAKQEVGLTNDQ